LRLWNNLAKKIWQPRSTLRDPTEVKTTSKPPGKKKLYKNLSGIRML
jgi:hypothetical protein